MLSTTDETADVPVRRIDQDQINEFGRLNARKHDVLEELETETKRKQDLEDADESVTLSDGGAGAIKIVIGSAFVDVDATYAQEYLEKAVAANQAATTALRAELRDIASRQAELKKVLYARFGKTINLEE